MTVHKINVKPIQADAPTQFSLKMSALAILASFVIAINVFAFCSSMATTKHNNINSQENITYKPVQEIEQFVAQLDRAS